MSQRDARYREYAALIAAQTNEFLQSIGRDERIVLDGICDVHPMNTKSRDDLGEGAYVESRIWIPNKPATP
jgi:hypothetical protein